MAGKKEPILNDICLGKEALEVKTGMPVTLINRLIELGLPHFQLVSDGGRYVFHLKSVSEWIYLKTKESRPASRDRRGDNPSVW